MLKFSVSLVNRLKYRLLDFKLWNCYVYVQRILFPDHFGMTRICVVSLEIQERIQYIQSYCTEGLLEAWLVRRCGVVRILLHAYLYNLV